MLILISMQRLLLPLILCLMIPQCSRSGDPLAGAVSFDAVTLRKKIAHFTNIESGKVVIPASNMPRMIEMNPDGSTKYFTSEIAGTFTTTETFNAEELSGLCIRFTVPAIAPKDYCFIKAEVHFPGELMIGGRKSSYIDSDFRFDARYSGRTEYIWFIFDKQNTSFRLPGKWELVLKNGERVVAKRSFKISFR